MKKLLSVFLLLFTLSVQSQVFNYTKVTDLEKECVCKASFSIGDSTVSITYKDSTKTYIIKSKIHIKENNIYKISVDDDIIDILTISYGIAIINYIDPKRKEVQFLNID